MPTEISAQKSGNANLLKLTQCKLPDDPERLAIYFDALGDMADAALAVINQPRAGERDEYLDAWYSALLNFRGAVVQKARTISPCTAAEARAKAEILLAYEVDCGIDEPADLLSVVSTCLQDISTTQALEHAKRT